MAEKLFSLPTEVARAIAAARRLKRRTCLVCQQEFTTVGRGLYCSDRCRARAYYQRHIEKERLRRRAYYERRKERQTSGPGQAEG
jgi:hypothetical protein